MGAYNLLIVNVQCPNCKNTYEAKIQFKYGDTWQLQYRLGDKLKWGGNDIGVPGWPCVKVYGILETDICPVCNQINLEDEFDIYIEHDVLKEVRKMDNIEDYFLNDGSYKLME
ncbi:hypothetical protein HHL17_23250 [Chitinophaga sp. G-6-1-13]|uniref:Uncharacterized protein n=1 Tax=Chitinophaga fulva TaxID=2728842 RepID=A0A848GNE1_9BACT|nr:MULTISPECIES: hypothetical protein [Chitinophaga]NML40135.1 hypothetical protein [Chitinophaga fulva]